jgi:hypothetical protein
MLLPLKIEGGEKRKRCILDAVRSSGILKAKQKLGVTFNFDKQDVIDLTKFSKMTKSRASEANSEK